MLTSAFAALYKATAAAGGGVSSAAVSRRPELEYWKAINSVAPPKDPQVLFLLMAEYSNAQLQGEGAEFLSARLKEFGPRLTDSEKALYLSAVGLLRAQHASSVPLILSTKVYGMSPSDPLAILPALAGIATMTLAAAMTPARRAASLDPMRA